MAKKKPKNQRTTEATFSVKELKLVEPASKKINDTLRGVDTELLSLVALWFATRAVIRFFKFRPVFASSKEKAAYADSLTPMLYRAREKLVRNAPAAWYVVWFLAGVSLLTLPTCSQTGSRLLGDSPVDLEALPDLYAVPLAAWISSEPTDVTVIAGFVALTLKAFLFFLPLACFAILAMPLFTVLELVWLPLFFPVRAAAKILSLAAAPFGLGSFAWRPPPPSVERGGHGTARWKPHGPKNCTPRHRLGHRSIVGYASQPKKGPPDWYAVDGHVTCIASTGRGKSTGILAPNLLRTASSTVVFDPKGELFALTSAARKKMGQQIYVVDPYGMTSAPSATLDIRSILLDAEDITVAASVLADALVVRAGKNNQYWDTSAQRLLQALLVIASEKTSVSCLDFVFEALHRGPDFLADIVRDSATPNVDPHIARAALIIESVLDRAPAEFSGIVSTASTQLSFLDDTKLRESLSASEHSVDLAALRQDPGATIYLVLPPPAIVRASRWLRVWFGSTIDYLVHRHQGRPARIVIDEASSLGRFRPLLQSLAILRGYGISLQTCWQSISQMHSSYSESEANEILANSTLVAFGIQDHFTAAKVSAVCGDRTQRITTTSTSVSSGESSAITSLSSSKSEGVTHAESFVKRPLITPDEVRRLSPRQSIVIEPGEAPAIVQIAHYFEDPELAEEAGENPYYRPEP